MGIIAGAEKQKNAAFRPMGKCTFLQLGVYLQCGAVTVGLKGVGPAQADSSTNSCWQVLTRCYSRGWRNTPSHGFQSTAEGGQLHGCCEVRSSPPARKSKMPREAQARPDPQQPWGHGGSFWGPSGPRPHTHQNGCCQKNQKITMF